VAKAVQALQSTTDASLRDAKVNLEDLISQAELRYATLADKLAVALSKIEESASRLNRVLEDLARDKSQLHRDFEAWVQDALAREAPQEEKVSELKDRLTSAEERVEGLERQVKQLKSQQWQSVQKLSSVEEDSRQSKARGASASGPSVREMPVPHRELWAAPPDPAQQFLGLFSGPVSETGPTLRCLW